MTVWSGGTFVASIILDGEMVLLWLYNAGISMVAGIHITFASIEEGWEENSELASNNNNEEDNEIYNNNDPDPDEENYDKYMAVT